MTSDLKSLIGKLDSACRGALEKAAKLCVAQTHYNVEVEHFLLELLQAEPGDLRAILRYYEVDSEHAVGELRKAMEDFKRGSSRTPAFTPLLVHLLEEAWLISSVRLGAGAILSGAVLLALLEDEQTRLLVVDSCPSLARISIDRLREDLPELATAADSSALPTGGQGASVSASPDRAVRKPSNSATPSLDQYSIDLTAQAEAGKIDPIRGRSREIRQLVDILTRRRQNNPILVGDAGVGKTAIVEGLALRVAAGDVPRSLQRISVRILDLALLQAGAGVKGEFEERLKKVIQEVESSPEPIILFIDEAHTMIGAGGSAGQGDAANLLKPALARGDLRTIAATTWSEYKKYFEKDPALARRFQLVKVDEPDEEVAIDMLRGIAAKLEEHHDVRVLDQAVRDAVGLSSRYLSERRLPDKAISVLDTACARVALAQDAKPARLEDVDRRLTPIELEIERLEKEESVGSDHEGALERLRSELSELQQARGELEERWQQELELAKEIAKLGRVLDPVDPAGDDTEESQSPPDQSPGQREKAVRKLARLKKKLDKLQDGEPMVPAAVDAGVVAEVIASWTGIPVGRMLTDEIQSVLALESRMAERLVGQPEALNAICKRISTSRAELDDPSKPQGVFLLVGPSGVGKTETALVLAEILYGGAQNVVSLNMSEFQEPHSVATLKGSPPGYVGFGEGGVLTEAVRRRPYSVVLLDEVEKAHSDVMELFYQVFDKGTLEDGEGVQVDFKHSILLLTCNLGADAILDACHSAKERPTSEALVEWLKPDLQKAFKPALLARLTIVPYYPLDENDIGKIVALKLETVKERIWENHRAVLSWSDDLVASIGAGCSDQPSGARNIDHILTQTLLPDLSAELLDRMARDEHFSTIHVAAGKDGALQYEIGD